jgi:class 3 adenylate cyclase
VKPTSPELSSWLAHISGQKLLEQDFVPGAGFIGDQRLEAFRAQIKAREEEEEKALRARIEASGNNEQARIRILVLDLALKKGRVVETFGTKVFSALIGFIDMCGFSELARDKAPREVHQIAAPFIQATAICAQKFLAFIDKTIGDEVMVVMPWFEEHRALTELGIRDVQSPGLLGLLFGAYLASLLQEKARDIAFSCGFAFGRVALGEVGGADYHEWTVYGNCVNAAKRLQAVAFAKEPEAHALKHWMAIGAISNEEPDFAESFERCLEGRWAKGVDLRRPCLIDDFKGVGLVSYLRIGFPKADTLA